MLNDSDIDAANRDALGRVAAARPLLVDLRPAGEVVPGLGTHDLLHAGPPLAAWSEACGALRGAVAGTLMLAGVARDAAAIVADGPPAPWRLRSAAEVGALGTFGGVITCSTPVFVVEDAGSGVRAFAAINEGRGAALRYGSTTPETLARVSWLHGEFALLVRAAVRRCAALDLFAMVEQALQMGDDGHSRQKAASALFLAALAPALVQSASTPALAVRALEFLAANDFFFLPLAMAAARSALRAAEGTPGSTLVTAIAFNGMNCGVRVAGLHAWSTAPLPSVRGAYFRGFGEADAGPVIGDSEIMETLGLGACAMAAAPALARYVGGSVEEANRFTADMYAITLGEHPRFRIPALDGRGTPFGIDVRKVLARGITPVFNTGIAHREIGVGQIGAGHGRVPLACFEAAARALGLARG